MLKNGIEYIDALGGFKGRLHNGTRTGIWLSAVLSQFI